MTWPGRLASRDCDDGDGDAWPCGCDAIVDLGVMKQLLQNNNSEYINRHRKTHIHDEISHFITITAQIPKLCKAYF